MTKPRQSEPTLKDIADAAGVSVAAVSKVLNNREGVGEATRARVRQLMDQLGYRGRSGRQDTPSEITLVTLEQYVANDAFYGKILSGISATGQRLGHSVNLGVFRSLPEILLPGRCHWTGARSF